MTTEAHLEQLESSGLIRVAAVHPELEYLFRHWLVQDTAYNSLLKRERRKLHRLVGEAIEEIYPDRRDELSAELAVHFEEAGDERALGYLLSAAEYAQRRFAIHEARSFYERALRLVPEGDDPQSARLRIEIVLGSCEVGWTFSEPDTEIATLHEITEAAESLGDERLLVRLYSLIAMLRQYQGEKYGVSPELTFAIDRATELGDKLGDPGLRAVPLTQLGWALAESGRRREGLAVLEEAVPLLEQADKLLDLSFVLDALAIGYAQVGEFELAEDRVARSIALAERGDPVAKLDAASAKGAVKLFRNDIEAAMESASWCAVRAEEIGVVACSIGSHLVMGMAYMTKGRPDLALKHLERGLELSLVSLKFWQPLMGAVRATVHAMLGDFPKAISGWQAALDRARAIGDEFVEASVLQMRSFAATMGPDPDWSRILADLEESIRLFEKLETRPFLARALRDYGTALTGAGRPEEAGASLKRALGLFEEMGLTAEADMVRGLQAPA